MVQIHDEQRSIQMTMLHRDIHIHKNTGQTSVVITNNGSKNSKCKPESERERDQQVLKTERAPLERHTLNWVVPPGLHTG